MALSRGASAAGAFPFLRVSRPETGSVSGAFDTAWPPILVAENGAKVTQVNSGSPATRLVASSGTTTYLEPGDVIVAVDGRKVNEKDECVD